MWWIFFGIKEDGDDKLYIAFSEDLFGDWKMHKKNPVKSNVNSARSAGEIFFYQKNLYRPSQNCSNSYGGSITINKIIKLTKDEFEEVEEKEIFPNQLDLYPSGLHHISKLGDDLTLIDGRRTIFVFYKPLVSILRNLKRIFL